MQNLILTLALLQLCTAHVVIKSPSNLAGEYVAVAYTFIGDTSHWNISGQLVRTDPSRPCDQVTNSASLAGAIAVTQAGHCSTGTQAKTVQALGAIGMLVLISQPNSLPSGFPAWTSDDGNGLEHFPIADFVPRAKHQEILDALSDPASIIMATVEPDPNYMQDEAIWAPYTVFIGTFALVNVCLAAWKLYGFIKLMGPRLVLSQIVLGFEFFSNTMRFVHSLQPSSCGRGLWNSKVQSVIFTFSWPYSFIATMMIAFYWEETLLKFSSKAGLSRDTWTSLSKMKIPAVIASVILVVFEHTFSSLRASGVTTVDFSVYIVSVLYLVIALVVGVYFVVTGCRIVLFLRGVVSNSGSGTHVIKKMSLLLVLSGMGLFMYVLGNIITASTVTTGTVHIFAVGVAIMFVGLDVSSFTQILCFTPPVEDSSLNSKTPKSSSGNQHPAASEMEVKSSVTTNV